MLSAMPSLEEVLDYVRRNRAAHPLPALREQLVKDGVAPELVELAFRSLGEAPPAEAAAVLVVEDDPAQMALYQKLLAGRGLRVVAAVDQVQASVFLRQARIEAAILDFAIPGGNGAQVYGLLRRSPATASCPVLFVSGSVPPDYIAGILRSDPRARHLPKPVRPSTLLDALTELLDGKPPAPGA